MKTTSNITSTYPGHNTRNPAFSLCAMLSDAPGISTGVYGYPAAQAAKIAVETVHQTLKICLEIEKVVFCCFFEKELDVYESLVE